MLHSNDGLLTAAGRFAITRNAANGLPELVSADSFQLSRAFNGYGDVDAAETLLSSSSVFSYNLARNISGRITAKNERIEGTNSQFAYSYDNIGRLLTVARDGLPVEEYRYDNNGSRTYEMNALRGISGRTFAHSLEDHTLNAGPISYEFDYDDNLTARREGTETTEYRYSSTGELQRVTLPDNTLIEYINDPLGRRIAKKVGGAIVKKYLWLNQTTLLAVYDGSGNLLQRFEYADDRVPYAMTAGGTTYYLAYDQVGSLRLITDYVGNTVKRVDYDSFGNIISDSNPAFAIPFGFAGGLHDRDTKLVRFGFRDYMPEIGKWTAKDPILFAGGDSNFYGYVTGNPVNFIDPFGLETIYHGYATYYNLPGSQTASGGIFDPTAFTAAMTSEKASFGTEVTVEYTSNDGSGTNSVCVEVNDRGPFARGPDGKKPLKPFRPDPEKIIDLTPAAFEQLVGSLGPGKVPVAVRVP